MPDKTATHTLTDIIVHFFFSPGCKQPLRDNNAAMMPYDTEEYSRT